MPQRLKFIVAYDGAPFAGWQSQACGNAVQDHLERAFAAVTGSEVRVQGAGRTDAGVHALAQCAHVDLPERSLRVLQWPLALNAQLLPTIRVLRCAYVRPGFHARFSAVGKAYRYRIWNHSILPPLELGRAWHVSKPIDSVSLRTATKLFVGRHDFAAYAANRGKPEQSTVRTIEGVRVHQGRHIIEIEFSGDGFLYKMVRLMVGALVRCATGRISANEIQKHLQHLRGGDSKSLPRLVAPAHGLTLIRVRY